MRQEVLEVTCKHFLEFYISKQSPLAQAVMAKSHAEGITLGILIENKGTTVHWNFDQPINRTINYQNNLFKIIDIENVQTERVQLPVSAADVFATAMKYGVNGWNVAEPTEEEYEEKHTIWTFADGSYLIRTKGKGLRAYDKGEAFCL